MTLPTITSELSEYAILTRLLLFAIFRNYFCSFYCFLVAYHYLCTPVVQILLWYNNEMEHNRHILYISNVVRSLYTSDYQLSQLYVSSFPTSSKHSFTVFIARFNAHIISLLRKNPLWLLSLSVIFFSISAFVIF